MPTSPQSSQLLPVLTFGRGVEVPLLHTQLPVSQRRRSQTDACNAGTRLRIYTGMSAPSKTTGFASVRWLVLAESLVLCLASAAMGLAFSMVLLPALSLRPALGLDVMPVVEIAAAL